MRVGEVERRASGWRKDGPCQRYHVPSVIIPQTFIARIIRCPYGFRVESHQSGTTTEVAAARREAEAAQAEILVCEGV